MTLITYLFSVNVWVYMCICTYCVCERRSQASLRKFILSLNYVGDSGIKLRLSDLLSSAFIHWVILCAPSFLAKALPTFLSLKAMWTGESSFLQLEGNLLCSLGSCTVSFAASICGALSQDRGMQQQTAQNLAKQKALDSTMNRSGQFPGNWVYVSQ